MIAKASVRYLRMTPRKVGYLIGPIRRRSVREAMTMLAVANRRAAQPVAKLIASAFANARVKDATLREEDVIISKATADEGPRWKRSRAAPFGRAARVLKRTTHVSVELEKR